VTSWANKGIAGDGTKVGTITKNDTGINNKNTVHFERGAYFDMPNYTASNSKASMFVVMKGNEYSNIQYMFMFNPSGGPDCNVTDVMMGVMAGLGSQTFTTTTSVGDGYFLYPSLLSYVLSDSVASLNGAWLNGVAATPPDSFTTTISTYNGVKIGDYDGSGDNSAVNAYDMAELIVFQQELSQADRQSVEGYLAWKWGFHANLPSDHPYYSVAPTSSTVIPPDAATITGFTSVTTSGFTVSWSGAARATSFSYTLNGVAITPVTSSSTQASFSALLNNTAYSVVVKAINNGGITISSSSSVTTLRLVSPYSVSAPLLWFDASDTSTIGANLWTNKGTGFDASSDQITSSTLMNNLNTLAIIPGQSYFNFLTYPSYSSTTYKSSAFVVMRGTTNTIGGYTIILNNTGIKYGIQNTYAQVNGNGFVAGTNGTTSAGLNNDQAINYSFSGSTSVTSGSFLTSNMFSFVANGNSTTSPAGAWLNGTLLSLLENNGGTTSTIYRGSIGGDRPYSDNYDLGEIIVFQDELSVSNRQKIEGYLAWKWGLQANLPSSHPYYNSAPVATGSAPSTLSNLSVANITSYGFDVSWSTGSGATSYIYTLNGIVTTPTTDNALSSSSISFNNLIESQNYILVIKAINSHGVSISITNVTMLAATAAPDAPASLSSSNITTTGFTVSWTGALGVSQYLYSIDGEGVFADIDPSNTLNRYASFTGTIWLAYGDGRTMTLSSGTSYDVIVTAMNTFGSTDSATFTVTTL